jgi:hypothetical protein
MHLKTLGIQEHNMKKCGWSSFMWSSPQRFGKFPHAVRGKLKAAAIILSEYGPQLGRPYVDTLNGSRYAKMKELRFNADGGAWRVAFAFDLERKAISVGGWGQGGNREDAILSRI